MREDQRTSARIMVVDDEPQNVRYVTDVLQWAGYENVEGLTDPGEAVTRFHEFEPDLVILDLLMPAMDGFQVMEAMKSTVGGDVYLPFLILTSDISSESRRRALSSGARDFLTKPMSPTEVRLRVDNLLETRFLYLECARQADLLGGQASAAPARSAAMTDGIIELLERWGASIDAMVPGLEGRSKRVSWLAARLAEALDHAETEVESIRVAALLHDLGSRPGPGRPPDEPASVHVEPEAGVRLLEGSSLPALVAARRMLTGLEEHWDGSGEPEGLRGTSIPIEARIVAVARAHDDFERASQRSPGDPVAAERIEELAGSWFDPDVVAALAHAQAVGA